MIESWRQIESDPGIFTVLLEEIGVKKVQIEELYSTEQEELSKLEPIYGLIFLFRLDNKQEDTVTSTNNVPKEVFFAAQTVENACASQAILNIVLNSKDIEIGPNLAELRKISENLSYKENGNIIANSLFLKEKHNSFAPYDLEPSSDDEDGPNDGDNYHFIAYVPVGQSVYELDGLKDRPIHLCDIPESSNWISSVIPFIQERMNMAEITFSLMALIKERKIVYQEKLLKCVDEEEIKKLQFLIKEEEEKVRKYKDDAQLLRADYSNFIKKTFEILTMYQNSLKMLIQKAHPINQT